MVKTIISWSFVLILLPSVRAAEKAPVAPVKAKQPVTDRGNLGVLLESIRPGEADEGARINYVYPESAAQAMGLRPGDEVIEVNGIEVKSRAFLAGELQQENIGSKVSFKIRRGNEVLQLRVPMGSYLKTRKAFLDHCRRELGGKPFAPVAQIIWPDGVDGLKALKGKVGVVISFDDCESCIKGKWGKISEMEAALRKAGAAQDWLAFAGIYSNIQETQAKNLEARRRILARAPGRIPIGVARYPDDRIPIDSADRDPLVQDHGVAILDPEGKLFYLELENPAMDFLKAFQEAEKKYGTKPSGKASPLPAPAGPPPKKE